VALSQPCRCIACRPTKPLPAPPPFLFLTARNSLDSPRARSIAMHPFRRHPAHVCMRPAPPSHTPHNTRSRRHHARGAASGHVCATCSHAGWRQPRRTTSARAAATAAWLQHDLDAVVGLVVENLCSTNACVCVCVCVNVYVSHIHGVCVWCVWCLWCVRCVCCFFCMCMVCMVCMVCTVCVLFFLRGGGG
jgi:hypothetical protein